MDLHSLPVQRLILSAFNAKEQQQQVRSLIVLPYMLILWVSNSNQIPLQTLSLLLL